MATNAILTVRTDSSVKKAAQKAAKDLGVPLSVVVNASLRAFVRNPRIELEPYTPNARTRRHLKAALKMDPNEKVFDSIEELIADLNK
jgi:addiction module RelB/DinJ family antitoxin